MTYCIRCGGAYDGEHDCKRELGRIYQTAEDYVRGEYGEELPIIRSILTEYIPEDEVLDLLAMRIVGYYTGCLREDGSPRVSTRPKRP